LYVGQQMVVEGSVTAAERDGNVVRLHLGRQPSSLTVSLVIGLLSTFPPDPERSYAGQRVRVAGVIRSFRDATEIVVHDPADIQVIGAPAGPSRRDAIEHRLEELRARVQQLERALERGPARPEPAP